MKPPPQIPPELLNQSGPRFWKSLEEWSHSPEFLPYLHREFPSHASEWEEGMDRRRFLQLIAASLALAGLSGCTRQPQEKIVPYVQRPEELIPGEPLFYATTFPQAGYGKGILVRTDMARPTKIEGNPDHPASLGASDLLMQASVLDLYDPDRSQMVLRGQEISSWDAFIEFARSCVAEHEQDQGAGLFLLTGRNSSPSLADQLRRFQQRFPKMSWCEYEPTASLRLQAASGNQVEPIYDFSGAEIIVSLDSDFLFHGPASIANTKAFSQKRREPRHEFSRLYVVESALTVTGAKADVRLRRKPSEIVPFAQELADAILNKSSSPAADIKQIVADLWAQPGKSVVIAGDYQPPIVHYLAYQINQALGNIGTTVRYMEGAAPPIPVTALPDFIAALQRGAARTLLIAGINPVYDLPADLDFAEGLGKVSHAVHLGLYQDETGSLCHWHLPESHYLEAWGDIMAFDGTPSLIQPLIQPLYPAAISIHELLSSFLDTPPRRGYDLIHDFWLSKFDGSDPENAWNHSLNKGVVYGLKSDALPAPVPAIGIVAPMAAAGAGTGLEILFRPDPSVSDGRHANNSWLQELPRPLTKLTWDNAALVSPNTAEKLHLKSGDEVRLTLRNRSLEAPILIQPGHADDTITAHLGYGRWGAGEIGNGVGFNANALRSTAFPWADSGVDLQMTGRSHLFAITEHHFSMEGRGLVQVQSLLQTRTDPGMAKLNSPAPAENETLYPPHEYKNYAWAMSIDLSSCIGCNACIVSCQSENNIPVVGKDQVRKGREMHWLRVDRYFAGEPEEPEIHFQPVPCMHCENAPCEVVCPVAATSHTSEGLNDMIYNRCVGTRYCSNNCPYKVRRFNFLEYSDERDPVLALQKNPDVTVRSRGVMEKCTYCVQRIESARIQSQKEMRSIRDGEILTACQSACPADAIVFGNINDPDSRVSRLKKLPRDYGLLAELNTRPRTTYLAKVINPPSAA